METQFGLLLTGGIVVTGAGMQRADVGVRGEIVAQPGRGRFLPTLETPAEPLKP